MAKFTHTVEAEKFDGNLDAIMAFISNEEAFYDEVTKTLFVPELISRPNIKWEAKEGDYIVKTLGGFNVYNSEEFKAKFRRKRVYKKRAKS